MAPTVGHSFIAGMLSFPISVGVASTFVKNTVSSQKGASPKSIIPVQSSLAGWAKARQLINKKDIVNILLILN